MLRAGLVAASIYNANPFRGQNARLLTPYDFAPDPEAQKEPTEEEKLQQFKEWIEGLKRAQDEKEKRGLEKP